MAVGWASWNTTIKGGMPVQATARLIVNDGGADISVAEFSLRWQGNRRLLPAAIMSNLSNSDRARIETEACLPENRME